MKISYSWFKNYLPAFEEKVALSVEEVGVLLTDCGLEIEAIETYETVQGGLKGIVVGEVKTKEKHPDADRLSITTVDIGKEELLNIVCGAPNVEVGQKVMVATIGTTLYSQEGESFKIKKSKIRGQLSEGMICAEDELGLGNSHEGIMVLDPATPAGIAGAEYCSSSDSLPTIEEDTVFEIGLTPNRSDATSHIGVARDLVAVVNCLNQLKNKQENNLSLSTPDIDNFKVDNTSLPITVEVEDNELCPRYSGLTISNVSVAESPNWLKHKLQAIGLRPVNNVVDITNYVLHEYGQPMHAFNADKISGNKVIVKTLPEKTKFTTLDEVERELSSNDLMICNAEEAMCIAGVFGGKDSGVTESTSNIFLESAYFNPTTVRKSSKRHDLKTDASFRYERGADPNITVVALKRAALLIKELAGGEISSEIVDIYPKAINNFSVEFSFDKCNQLIGKSLDKELIKNILIWLDIVIENESEDTLQLSVPAFKVDVTREQDVIEEVLRVYGYNNVEIPSTLNSSIQFSTKPDHEKIQNTVANLLSNNGYYEMMCLSLTKGDYAEQLKDIDAKQNVSMLNPLSSDLNVLRQTMLFSGLETIAYNQNRKQANLKLYEFGKTYLVNDTDGGKKYTENKNLSLFLTGLKQSEGWNSSKDQYNFYSLKGVVLGIIEQLGITGFKLQENDNQAFSNGLKYTWKKQELVSFGTVSKEICKLMGIKQEVHYANFNWSVLVEALQKNKVMYTEVAKFPEVRRDLALLLNNNITFSELEKLAFEAERKILKAVNLFDVYEGSKLPSGKKSYALSFTLQDSNATLTDKQIDKVMDKLIKVYQEKVSAELR